MWSFRGQWPLDKIRIVDLSSNPFIGPTQKAVTRLHSSEGVANSPRSFSSDEMFGDSLRRKRASSLENKKNLVETGIFASLAASGNVRLPNRTTDEVPITQKERELLQRTKDNGKKGRRHSNTDSVNVSNVLREKQIRMSKSTDSLSRLRSASSSSAEASTHKGKWSRTDPETSGNTRNPIFRTPEPQARNILARAVIDTNRTGKMYTRSPSPVPISPPQSPASSSPQISPTSSSSLSGSSSTLTKDSSGSLEQKGDFPYCMFFSCTVVCLRYLQHQITVLHYIHL